jgi:hypothetical protein
VLTVILQLIGLSLMVGASSMMFQLEPGTSALENFFVFGLFVVLGLMGLGLMVLGHRLRSN